MHRKYQIYRFYQSIILGQRCKIKHASSFPYNTSYKLRMKFKTVWLWLLIDTLNSSIGWDNLGERLYVTTTAHYVLFKDT